MTVWFPDGTRSTLIDAPPDLAAIACRGRPGGLSTGFVPAQQMAAHRRDWRSLEGRTAEPNVFFGSEFALATSCHIKGAHPPIFLLVRDPARPAGEQLVGLMPIVAERAGGDGPAFGTWRNPFMALGTPLLDRNCPTDVILAMLGALEARFSCDTVFAFRSLDSEGIVADGLRAIARTTGRPLAQSNTTSRAMLLPAGPAPGNGFAASTPKKRKELGRLRRRLGEVGKIEFALTDDYASLRPAFERFLHLEVAGWKGGRGTALLQDPGLAAFSRSAVWALAKAGEARIGQLSLDGTPIASVVVLVAERTAYLWKIAYDESFAKFGPGVMLIEDVSRTLLKDGIVAVDSCARQGNRMIEGLWSGVRRLADFHIGVAPGPDDGLMRAIEAESHRAQWRERAKLFYRRCRGWTH